MRKSVLKPWENRKTMGKPWKKYRKIIGHIWETYGKNKGNYMTHMGNPPTTWRYELGKST